MPQENKNIGDDNEGQRRPYQTMWASDLEQGGLASISLHLAKAAPGPLREKMWHFLAAFVFLTHSNSLLVILSVRRKRRLLVFQVLRGSNRYGPHSLPELEL